MKTGLYNVEFVMPGNFGSGTMLINEPDLLFDPLADFERNQQEDGKLLLETAIDGAGTDSLMTLFGVHHAVLCVTTSCMGQGLEIQVTSDDGVSFRLRTHLVLD